MRCKIGTHMLGEQRVGRIEDLVTLDNDTTIQEALDYGYVVGKKESIKQLVSGVLKAMVDGIKKDGDGRKIDNFLSINAYARAYLKDVTDDFNRSTGKIAIRARMLKEFTLDVSGWSFLVEGAIGQLDLTSITTGRKIGEVDLGQNVSLNGKGLDGEVTVAWKVDETGETGTIGASHITNDETRVTINRDGWQELFDETYDGKTLIFTVTIGNKKAVKSAVIRYVD